VRIPDFCTILTSFTETYFVRSDADVNLLCQKAPPIFWAAYQGKTEVCRYLWSKGADILLEDEDGENILFRPASSGGLETLKFLVEEAKCPVDGSFTF
jgi:hypothetical protein